MLGTRVDCSSRFSRLRSLLLFGTVALAACGTGEQEVSNTDVQDSASQKASALTTEVGSQTTPERRSDGSKDPSAGSCCWGHCNGSGAFKLAGVRSGCREAVVNTCHYYGWAFNPDGDAWWGAC